MKNLHKIKLLSNSIRIILIVLLLSFNFGCFLTYSKDQQKLNRLLIEGNNAYEAKQYDKALSLFEEGLRIEPNQPAFLGNKSIVLRVRAVEKYNASIKLSDIQQQKEIKAETIKDLQDADNLAETAIQELKDLTSIPFLDDVMFKTIKINIYSSKADSLRILATIGDHSKAEEALKAIHEYLEVEPDQEKRTKTQLNAGKMLIDSFKPDLAVTEYKKILADDENNADALLGVGMALAQSGENGKLKESRKYLEGFLRLAPSNHPQIATAKEILNSIPREG